MRISINLASHPYVNIVPLIKRLRMTLAIFAAVTVCMVILFLVARSRHNSVQVEAHLLDKTIENHSNELKTYQSVMHRSDVVLLADRIAALNQLFDEKAFSWTILMKDLEGVLPPQVQMATIRPVRGKDGSINLEIHLLGPRDRAIEFLQNLERSPRFSEPRISTESTQSESHATQEPPVLSGNSMEEFDVVTGYDVSQPPMAQPESSANLASLVATSVPQLSGPTGSVSGTPSRPTPVTSGPAGPRRR